MTDIVWAPVREARALQPAGNRPSSGPHKIQALSFHDITDGDSTKSMLEALPCKKKVKSQPVGTVLPERCALCTSAVINGKKVEINHTTPFEAAAVDALKESLFNSGTGVPASEEASAMISRAVNFTVAHNDVDTITRLIRNTLGSTEDLQLTVSEGQPVLMRLTSPTSRFSTAHALIACEVQLTALCTLSSPALDPHTVRVYLSKTFRQEISVETNELAYERSIDVTKVMRITNKLQTNSPLTAHSGSSNSSGEEILEPRLRANSFVQDDKKRKYPDLLPKQYSDGVGVTNPHPTPPLPDCTVPRSPLDVGMETKTLLTRKVGSFCLKKPNSTSLLGFQSPALQLDSQEILLFEYVK